MEIFLAQADAAAALATEGLKGMPWEKLGIVGFAYAVVHVGAGVLKSALQHRLPVRAGGTYGGHCRLPADTAEKVAAMHTVVTATEDGAILSHFPRRRVDAVHDGQNESLLKLSMSQERMVEVQTKQTDVLADLVTEVKLLREK